MGKKQIKAKITAAITLLDSKARKEQKQIKVQLCNKQCLIVRGCQNKKMKLDGEKKIERKFFIFISFCKPLT